MRKTKSIIQGIAAPLPESDIDTDAILPAQFLLLLEKKGMGKYLFHERRKPGATPRFVLDAPEYHGAKIIVGGPKFGIGSSREHAVWALADFGIECVIAPSFGDIFYANCFKNGVLPIALDDSQHAELMIAANRATEFIVNIEWRELSYGQKKSVSFDLDGRRQRAFLEGLDEIEQVRAEDGHSIRAFEKTHRIAAPWLHLSKQQLCTFENVEANNGNDVTGKASA
ncbi:MAG: 3-isopropylmalate dehydratase small subunit [Pseudomonadota bacterium]